VKDVVLLDVQARTHVESLIELILTLAAGTLAQKPDVSGYAGRSFAPGATETLEPFFIGGRLTSRGRFFLRVIHANWPIISCIPS
jgi:hypothetical protein